MKPKKLRPFWTGVSTASFIIRHSRVAVAGALFILVSIIAFMEGGKYSPMIGSGIGTWLLIRSRSLKKIEPNNIEMKRIEDADIESSLAEHFPKRLVKWRLQDCLLSYLFSSKPQSPRRNWDWNKKLCLVLPKFGVPENEFHRVKGGFNLR